MKSSELIALAETFQKRATSSFNDDIGTALRGVFVLEGWLTHIQQKYQFEPNVRDDFGAEMEDMKTAMHRIQKRLANLNPWTD